MIEGNKSEISKLFEAPNRTWTLDLPHGTSTFNTEPSAKPQIAKPTHYRERGIGRRRGEVRFFRSLLLLLSIEKWLCFPFLVPPIPDKSGWLRSLPLPSSLISSLRRQWPWFLLSVDGKEEQRSIALNCSQEENDQSRVLISVWWMLRSKYQLVFWYFLVQQISGKE